jgi:Domain of unknown function (DUF1883)
MNHLQSDLGHLDAGAQVDVTLRGTEANVMLVDPVNLGHYESGRRFEYFGGHFTRSPARVTVPRAGHWHVVVDLGGAAGRVEASVGVFAAR